MAEKETYHVLHEEWDGVLVTESTTVPVVGNTLVTVHVLEIGVVASNTEPVLEDRAGQSSLRVLFRVIRHESVLESVGSRLHKDTAKEVVEEVGVLAERLLETLHTPCLLDAIVEVLLVFRNASLEGVQPFEL